MTDVIFHPQSDTLHAYALGTLSPGMELYVAGHLTFCARCRDAVAATETIGGAEIAASDAPPPSLDATLAILDAADDEAPISVAPVTGLHAILPASVRAQVPQDEADIRWQFRLPGLHEYEFDGFDGETVSLLRARPGAKMLSHTHLGTEATLILQGAMADGEDVLRPGDVIEHDEQDDHRPEIVGDEICYCLIVMSGNLRFTGTFTRALNILMR